MFSGFRILKPGQGRYVRIGTAIGAGVVLAAFCYFLRLLLQESLTREGIWDYVNNGVPAVLFAVVGVLFYRLLNRPSMVDFLIATESEMKKVSWSSKRELAGSTLVVIITIIIMAVLLYFVDYIIFGLMTILKIYGD